jgi:hypothetical protein
MLGILGCAPIAASGLIAPTAVMLCPMAFWTRQIILIGSSTLAFLALLAVSDPVKGKEAPLQFGGYIGGR